MKKLFLAMMAVVAIALAGCKDKDDEPANMGGAIDCSLPANAAAVDLGLTSGIKWANMNVGAKISRNYGAYFAWGETTPKNEYTWGTYKYCQGSSTTLTKYCTDSGNGTVDNKTVLDPEDDAAHVNWGGDWRMPTKAEQDELRNECDWEWTDDYYGTGVKGYIVSSRKNSNSIFLPAAGSRGNESSYGVGTNGYYWSSSIGMMPYCAYELDFSSNGKDWYRNERDYGQSVRPVCK